MLLPEGEKELYVVLVTHRGDETLGAIIGSWGLHLTRGEDGTIAVSLADLPAAEDISVDGTPTRFASFARSCSGCRTC